MFLCINASNVFHCVWLLIEVHCYGVTRKNLFIAVFVIDESKPKTVGSFTNVNSLGALSTKCWAHSMSHSQLWQLRLRHYCQISCCIWHQNVSILYIVVCDMLDYIAVKASALEKPQDPGSTSSECHIFYLFRCVLSSMLPLRSVGRSNFDKVRHNLTTLTQETNIY